ncbi:amidohydrolase family protein [soil metagenome]
MIIDAHHHLWDPARADYPWLDDSLPTINRPMEFAELEPQLAAAGIDRTVLVQSANNAGDTQYMLEQATLHPMIAAVVGWVPLDKPELAAAQLDDLQKHPAFRGIRPGINHDPDADWLLRDDVTEGVRLLAERGLPFDLVSVRRRHLDLVTEFSQRHPTLRIVIDHLSKPPVKREDWEPWRTNFARAAENPLVFAKISGVFPSRGPMDQWIVDDLRPFVDYALDLFGPDRLMYGSDWPISDLAGGYARVWDGLNEIFDDLAPADRDAILGGTAARFYSITD